MGSGAISVIQSQNITISSPHYSQGDVSRCGVHRAYRDDEADDPTDNGDTGVPESFARFIGMSAE